MDPFIAEIVMFGGNFAPRGWAFCDGQLLAISSNQALFSILGTTFGGDGRTTFGLPDLRGRVPLGPRNGAGLSNRRLGEKSGTENVTLNTAQVPSHTHTATAHCQSGAANQQSPVGNTPAVEAVGATATYSDQPHNEAMQAGTVAIANTGGGQSHNNMQPFLGINFIIALQGIFPSRS